MKFLPNLSEKEGTGSLLLNQKARSRLFFLLLLFFLPTQLGLHLWPDFSFVRGLRVDYLSPTLYFTDVLAILLVASSPKVFLKLIKALLKYKKFALLAFLFVFLNIIYSSSPLSSIYYLIKILEMSALFVFVLKNFGIFRNLIAPIFATGILFESLLAILQFLKQASINGIFYFFGERFFSLGTPNIAAASINGELILRPYATFSHPNVLAAYILVGTFFILREAKLKRSASSIFYFVCLLFGFIAILLTLSRTPLILYMTSVLFLVFYKKFSPKVLFSFLAGFVGAILFFGQTLFDRFANTPILDESFVERLLLAKAAVKMLYDNLFLGVGLGSFLHELPNYYTGHKYFFLQPVHNIFLLFGAEGGIIGLILLTLTFAYLFTKTNLSGRVILLIILALGFFDHYFLTLQQGQLLFALSIAYVASSTKIKRLV